MEFSASPPRTIERAYRVRLRPTVSQARTLQRIMGARRFVWNWAISRQREARAAGSVLGVTALSREFTLLRQAPDTGWLAELPREPFNQTLRDLDRAWGNWRRGDARPPTRKRFGSVQSARFTLDQRREQVDREQGRVKLDRLGTIRFRVTEPLMGRLRSVTVSRDAAGRWFASFTADGVPVPASDTPERVAVGIDVGLASTATLSSGQQIAARMRLATKLARLRRYQRHFSRQRDAAARRQGLDPRKPFPKGTRIEPSNRMQVTRQRIGRLHATIADQRRDHLHQASAAAVAGAELIAIEDLAVKPMGRSMHRGFRRSVADAGLGELRRQITYKADWHQRELVVVDRWFPSSKRCSACGYVHAGLTLKDRRWTCPACGVAHNRDLNAAINLEHEGLRIVAQHTGPDGRTPRSGGTDARGEGACATGSSSPAGQPTSLNREPDLRGVKRRTRHRAGKEPARRREG